MKKYYTEPRTALGKRMAEKAWKNYGYYDTRKYRYEIKGTRDGDKLFRVELWKFDTTAILEPEAWEEVK